MIGCKRKRDKAHRDMRFAIRFNHWVKICCPSCSSEPIC